jgi:5-methylcytosine-specific restriction endonuclease McrA
MQNRNELIDEMQTAGGCTIKDIIDLEKSIEEIDRQIKVVQKVLAKTNDKSTRRLRMRFEILERDGFRCRYCGRSVAQGATLQIDHIVPRSKDGQDNIDNYITACSDCNLGKSDVLLELFIKWQLS